MKKKLEGKIMIPIVALFIISILVFRERAGISYDETDAAVRKWEYIYTPDILQTPECIILTSDEDISSAYLDIMETVLTGMTYARLIRILIQQC